MSHRFGSRHATNITRQRGRSWTRDKHSYHLCDFVTLPRSLRRRRRLVVPAPPARPRARPASCAATNRPPLEATRTIASSAPAGWPSAVRMRWFSAWIRSRKSCMGACLWRRRGGNRHSVLRRAPGILLRVLRGGARAHPVRPRRVVQRPTPPLRHARPARERPGRLARPPSSRRCSGRPRRCASSSTRPGGSSRRPRPMPPVRSGVPIDGPSGHSRTRAEAGHRRGGRF